MLSAACSFVDDVQPSIIGEQLNQDISQMAGKSGKVVSVHSIHACSPKATSENGLSFARVAISKK